VTPRRTEAGLTLIELMISVAIASIAMSTALAVGLTMGNQYRDHREIVTTERAARVSLDIMADAVRGASAGVASGTIQDAVTCPATSEAVRVTNNAAGLTIDGVDVMDETDVLEVIYASGGTYSALTTDYSAGDTELIVFDGDWLAGDYAIVTNLSPISAQGALVHISAVAGAGPVTLTIDPCADLSGGFVKGNLVIRARMSRFFVGDPSFPSLYMDLDGPGTLYEPEPIAPGIDDMQIAVGVDLSGDAIVDAAAGEWFYDVTGDPTAPVIGNAAEPWRALRIGLSARALQPSVDRPTFVRAALEDRTAGSPDTFRRRVLQTTVEIRNLGGSP
jgi:prepilin-type N-terminal cleavage/methylation domain-containing protein